MVRLNESKAPHVRRLVVDLVYLDLNLLREWLMNLLVRRVLSRARFSRSCGSPMSIPARQYLYAGKQGGIHGVFHFCRATGEEETRICRSSNLSIENFWEIIQCGRFSPNRKWSRKASGIDIEKAMCFCDMRELPGQQKMEVNHG